MPPVTIQIAASWLITVLLLSTRIGIVLALTPILGGTNLPIRVRVLFVFAFAAALSSALTPEITSFPLSPFGIALAMLNEVFWGGLLAFGLIAAFSAFILGGRILDMQMGFGLAAIVDPTTRTHNPLLGMVLHLFAIAWFLAADAHHAVLRGLSKSLQLVPLGSSITEVPINAIVYHFASMFSLGLVLVGAVVVCLLLVDAGMGVASRVLPQANAFVLSTPVKIFAGLTTLSVAALYMQPVLKKIFGHVFEYWEMVLVK